MSVTYYSLFLSIPCLLIAILGIKTEKNIINPLSIFTGVWGLIFVLSSFRLYTLNESQFSTYLIMFCGISFFVFGYYFVKIPNIRLVSLGSNRGFADYKLNYRLCYVFLAICFFNIGMNLLFNRASIFKYGFTLGAIQLALKDSTEHLPKILNAISFLIANPMYTALTVVSITDMCVGGKNKKLFIGILILSLLRAFNILGRCSVLSLSAN